MNHLDICLGNDGVDCGWSASTVYSDEENGAFNISSNAVSYWIVSCTFLLTIRLHKTAKEWKQLNGLLESKNNALINDFVDKLVLQHITPERIRHAITHAAEEAYDKGKDAARRKIREALGIGEPWR